MFAKHLLFTLSIGRHPFKPLTTKNDCTNRNFEYSNKKVFIYQRFESILISNLLTF